jgi:lipopolysaccharide export system permease protein
VILFRYLAKEVFVSMFAVSIVLLVIVMSGRLVKYLADAASGQLAPNVVLAVISYRIPGFLELVLPLGFFIGILLAYGRLYVESEMTVMSACGISTRRLSLYTLIPSVLVAAVVAYLSFFASPAGIAKVQEIFQDVKQSNSLELLTSGRFHADTKSGRVTYVEHLANDNQQMQNVFAAQNNSDGELTVTFAQQGQIEAGEVEGTRYLVLENGFQYAGEPGEKAIRVTQFEKFGQLIAEPTVSKSSYKKVDARTTASLLASDSLEDKAALQWRISLVILVPILALIAQALSRTNHRRGRYVKMFPAFLNFIFYLVMLNGARDAIEKQKLSLELGMWWVHGVFLALALVLLFGSTWWRYLRKPTSGNKTLSAEE